MPRVTKSKIDAKRLNGVLRIQVLGVAIIALIIAVVLIIEFVEYRSAIQQQEYRFTSIQHIQQNYELSVRKLLGSSLTDLREYDSCYHLGQSEIHFRPFPNGVLYCGMEVQGATYALESSSSASSNDWQTTLNIAVAVKNSLRSSGLQFTHVGLENSPLPNGVINYYDNYYLYGQTVRCDFFAENNYNPGLSQSIVAVQPRQIYFTLNCYQSTSKSFFHFVSSPLD